ncbi:hypothetical protein PM082_007631 [Marasmius tenuissimus]|nr:hypothetical protein PM082_007631 [Marasmius tenuissimus]
MCTEKFYNSFPKTISTRRLSQGGPAAFVDVPERSEILDIILYIAYGTSVDRPGFAPSFEMLSYAVARLQFYGILPKIEITSNSAFHATLMLYAPVHPLQLYALASKYDLSDLVACTSMHLLSFPLDQITDKVAEEIDPVYLARLLTLQRRRMKALTQFMCVSPLLHQPTPSCDIDAQKSVIKAWTFASAYLIWNAKPYLSPGYIDSVLRSLPDHAVCGLCKDSLNDRIRIVTEG